ncbi:c6 zinc finger domain containing protein [Niveomyces insectorum RCEF 264]|uniref:C6 zinc finger domain containing protein n=1 Tax=Niveomyces insectorum RCEF 264 TaxID=1081102 RepID=A0A167SGH3_9HYPO|nr:c6 zinc finger domain containing protein [Niveomyces insectorum RCEF 264]
MGQPSPVTSGDADSAWSDYRAMDSDDSHSSSAGIPLSPPPPPPPQLPHSWTRTDSSSSSSSSSNSDSIASSTRINDLANNSDASTSLLSLTRPGMDIPGAVADFDVLPLTAASSLSSAPTCGNSTLSSSPTLGYSTSPSSHDHAECKGDDCADHLADDSSGALVAHSPTDPLDEMQWEIVPAEQLLHPKLEPIDEDQFCLDDLQEAPFHAETSTGDAAATSAAAVQASTVVKTKRPRGRPRKLSIVPATPSSSKVTKGRSKTGCITCRKRKKKCDEAKPRCMNCEKNAVVCEGYPEKQIWKSGKEKAEEELLKNQSLPVITMQPIFIGLETAEDRIFWRHYNDHLSAVFTIEGEHKNAFQDMLVPLATRHQGAMHSILSLASKHLDYQTPYGEKILRKNTKTTIDSLRRRGDYHNDKAVTKLKEGMSYRHSDDPDAQDALAACYGQMLCFVLEALAEGDTCGSQRSHYDAFLYLIRTSPPADPAFHAFIVEIFLYHIFAHDLVYVPGPHGPRRLLVEGWTPPTPIHPPRMIGVADGLFNILSQITTMRHSIRTRIVCNNVPKVDYDTLYLASKIEADIHGWTPTWPAGDSRERVTLLYKQMTWLYLKTTICPPASSFFTVPQTELLHTQTDAVVDAAAPPHGVATSSCASSPSPKLEAMVPTANHFGNPRRHSIANPHMTYGARPFLQPLGDFQFQPPTTSSSNPRASPPPIRRPANNASNIRVAVEESLVLLESFKPSDPAQTLLLIPCVIVGAECYATAERERIRNAIRVVHGYTGLRNTQKALEVLEEVWRLIDLGDYSSAWDWQAVATRLGAHHLF